VEIFSEVLNLKRILKNLITIYGRSPGDGEKGDIQIKVINGYSTSIGFLKVPENGSSRLKRQNFSNSQISKSADTSCRNLMQIPTLIGVTSLQEKIASKNRHHGFRPDSHFFF
jgi:hypothetical protein